MVAMCYAGSWAVEWYGRAVVRLELRSPHLRVVWLDAWWCGVAATTVSCAKVFDGVWGNGRLVVIYCGYLYIELYLVFVCLIYFALHPPWWM